MVMWAPMFKVIPEGESGNVKVDHVEVTPRDAVIANMRGNRLSAGPLARLFVDGYLMMSDGDNEHATNSGIVHLAFGDVLIAGLGLGMILVPILRKNEVSSVTILEINPDVQKLVEPPIRKYLGEASDKLTVLVADVFTWAPPKNQKWDVIYFDVWKDICTDNIPEITKLKRRYCKKLRHGPQSWMGAWCESQLRLLKRRER